MSVEPYLNEQDPVFEVKLVVTLIAQDASQAALEADICAMSLAQIAEAMDEGDMVGNMALASCAHLPENQVSAALEAVGNDGEFFNHGADDAFPQGAKREDADGRILRLQVDQGWNSVSLGIQQKRFIEEVGLQDAFADWLERAARLENEMSNDDGIDGPSSSGWHP